MPIEHVDFAASEIAMGRAEELHSLPELFMENTRLQPYHAAGLRRHGRALAAAPWREVLRQSCKTYASAARVPLPDPGIPCTTPPFSEVIRLSRVGAVAPSSAPAALGAERLSRLLFYAVGVSASVPAPPPPLPATSLSPSELHPLECYVIWSNPEDVPPGIYHFNAWLHCLEALRTGHRDEVARELEALLVDGAEHGGAAAAVVTTAVPIRVCAFHGDRGYRMLLTEAGRAAERLRLGALALDLHARPVTQFYDDRVDRLLGLDGVEEFVVGLCLVGASGEEDAR